jgi:hypothetical protein
VIAMAEYLIVNENRKSKGNMKVATKKVIRRIEKKWLK